MSCKTCVNYGLFEMVTSGKPFGYSGNIPCMRCTRYRRDNDEYVYNTQLSGKPIFPKDRYKESI